MPVLDQLSNVLLLKFVAGDQTSLAKAPSELPRHFEPVAEVSYSDMCTITLLKVLHIVK
jgi:hypothetical protein